MANSTSPSKGQEAPGHSFSYVARLTFGVFEGPIGAGIRGPGHVGCPPSQLFPSLSGLSVTLTHQHGRAFSGPLPATGHICCRKQAVGLPLSQCNPQGPGKNPDTLASASASPSVLHSSPPHRLLSLLTGPSSQLVISPAGRAELQSSCKKGLSC